MSWGNSIWRNYLTNPHEFDSWVKANAALGSILAIGLLAMALASRGLIVLAEPVDRNDPQSVRKMRRIAEKLVECAMKGEGWAISQVADRIDGRPKQESDFSIASTRYVVEVPPQLSQEEWERKYALPTAQ